MKHRKRGALGLILSAAIGLGMVGGAAANSYIVAAQDSQDTIISGCVIRFSSPDGSPTIHANGAHWCSGIKSVRVTPAGRLQVLQTVTNPAKNPILFAFAQADETLNARGISFGASGGTADTEYTAFDATLGRSLDLSKKSDRMRLQGKFSNLWIGHVHMDGSK